MGIAGGAEALVVMIVGADEDDVGAGSELERGGGQELTAREHQEMIAKKAKAARPRFAEAGGFLKSRLARGC
jgi:hypothetical protein